MPEENTAATEAQGDEQADEAAHYECAFHVLPTVAEAEVPGVAERMKDAVVRRGGSITDEESPEIYDLAYGVGKRIDGVNRKFDAAYFGWVRFLLAPAALADLHEALAHMPELLRYLVVRLTRQEVKHPFSLFAMRRAADEMSAERAQKDADEHAETDGPISETQLNESLEKLTE